MTGGVGAARHGGEVCGYSIDRGADACCHDPSAAVGMTEKGRGWGEERCRAKARRYKSEERFLSTQADRLAGAGRERKSVGLLRSVPQNHAGCPDRIGVNARRK